MTQNPILHQHRRFNIRTAYDEVVKTARDFDNRGYRTVWIYLIENRLQFHHFELNIIARFLVAQFKVDKLAYGLTKKEWRELGRKIESIHAKQETSCQTQEPSHKTTANASHANSELPKAQPPKNCVASETPPSQSSCSKPDSE